MHGVTLSLECPGCGLHSGRLDILSGDGPDYYGVAWCPRCRKFTTPLVKDPREFNWPGAGGLDTGDLEMVYTLDDRRLATICYREPGLRRPRCLGCQEEVSLFDMVNRLCPVCGTPMKEKVLGLWTADLSKCSSYGRMES